LALVFGLLVLFGAEINAELTLVENLGVKGGDR